MIKEFTMVRKLKLVIVSEDEELTQKQYQFIRDSQDAQNRALNLAYSQLLSVYLNSCNFRNKEFQQVYQSLSVRKLPLNFGTGIDTQSLVVRKVKQDFRIDHNGGLGRGERSGRNYKKTVPLMTNGRDLKFYYNGDDVMIKWVHRIVFKVVIGREDKDFEELRKFLHYCVRGINFGGYKIKQSELHFKNKNLMLNLTIGFMKETNYEPVIGRVLGIDLGIRYPAYCTVSDNLRINSPFGEFSDFARIREQFRVRKQRLDKSITYANGGHGRKDKCKALKNLKDKERRWTRSYNHQLANRIASYALKNKCESIHLEDLSSKNMEKRILSVWSYYELQKMIGYKANLLGIKVYKVNAFNTSRTCSICGYIDKNNRKKQDLFKCQSCGFETNADYNASVNIAKSKPIKKFDGEKFVNI